MRRDHEHDSAQRLANLALASRRDRGMRSFSPMDMRAQDPPAGRWELLADVAVAAVTIVLVLIAWFY